MSPSGTDQKWAKCVDRTLLSRSDFSVSLTISLKKKKRIHLRMQETQEMRVLSLGWDDPLEKEMATHSSILAWKIPWTEEPGGLQSTGSQRVR